MSKNTSAVDLETPISTIRERLTGTLADWGADFSTLLKELEEKRAVLQEIEAETASQSHEVEALHKRVKVQDTQIEALKIEAAEAVTLRKEIHDKDLELEKKNSELDSKRHLIDALRRDAKGIGQLKGDIRTKDKEIAHLVKEKQHAPQHAAKLTEDLKILAAELEAARAKLEELQAQESAEDISEDLTAATAPHDMREQVLDDTDERYMSGIPLARLEIRHEGEVVDNFELPVGRTLIGRTSSNDLTIPSREISGHHAQIVTDLKQCVLEDLKSTNGVYVGRKRVGCHQLKDGNIIAVGKHKILYRDLRAKKLGGPDRKRRGRDRVRDNRALARPIEK
jgi:pSer/pThr/pTyr-binding forkhead associated (FHA) protein